MKKLQELGKMLSKQEQKKIMGGYGGADDCQNTKCTTDTDCSAGMRCVRVTCYGSNGNSYLSICKA